MRDSDVRRELRRHLAWRHRDEPDTLLLDEFVLALGQARVDVAVLNGSLIGYEIKSDVDSLVRLENQLRVYDAVLDYAFVVAGVRHYAAISERAPRHWGLLRAVNSRSGPPQLELVREATFNTGVDAMSLAMMLWRDELVSELKARDAYRGLSTCPKNALWRRLIETVEIEELRDVVRARIKARGNWRADPSRFPRGG